MKSKKIILAALALVAVLGILLGVYFATRPQVQEGSKTFTLVVVHGNGSEERFTISSAEEYMAPALIAEGIINTEGVETGMYFTVDGETASWETNKSYWAIYIGEEYANDGLNTLVIQEGGLYKLVYTLG